MGRIRIGISLLILFSIIVSAAGFSFRPAAHAAATPALALPINAVAAGTTSALDLSATGFTPNGEATLKLDGGATLGLATINADGAFTATVTITDTVVPAIAIGLHHLQAIDSSGLTAAHDLYVLGLRLSTPMAPAGSRVGIIAQGFPKVQRIVVRLGAKTVLTSRTDKSGRLDQTFTVPAGLTDGQKLTLVSGQPRSSADATGAVVAQLAFTVTHASLVLDPASVAAGSPVSASGSGFAAHASLTLMVGSVALGKVTTDAAGAFGPTKLLVPAAVSPGPHTVTLAGPGEKPLAAAVLTISASPATAAITPKSGVAGEKVSFVASGFTAGEPVRITADGHQIADVRADKQGRVSTSLTLPQRVTGSVITVTATGSLSHQTASVAYNVPAPTLTIDPASAAPGALTRVTGRNFAAFERITVSLDATAVSTRADRAGAFTLTLRVPPGQAGAIAVTAVGVASGIKASAPFTRIVLSIPTDTPTNTSTPSFTATNTATASATATQTVAPTSTHTMTATPTATPSHTATATHVATNTPTPTATRTHTATVTPSATPTLIPASLAVSPGTVAAGGSISVFGARFIPGEQIDLQLSPSSAVGGIHLIDAAGDTVGSFRASGIVIPSYTPAGSFLITAVGLSSARHARAVLQVLAPVATLNVQPSSFSPQDDIQLSGTNFIPGESVGLVLATTSGSAAVVLGTVQANSAGAFTRIKIHVPFGVPVGALHIVATGARSNRQAVARVTVNAQAPRLLASSSTVKPNALLTLTGTHFQPGEAVTVDLVALSSSTRLGTAQVGTAGTFTLSNARIPLNTPAGAVSLVATGVTSHLSAIAQVTVQPLPATLTARPNPVSAGSAIGVGGTGFVPGETVVVQLSNGPLPQLTLTSVIAGVSGSFSISKLVIPTIVPASKYVLSAFGQVSGRVARASLTVAAPPPSAPILSILGASGSPARFSPGSVVQLAGSHFAANASVTLGLERSGTRYTLGVVRTSAAGAMGPVGLTVPANTPPAAYALQALVGSRVVATVPVSLVSLHPTMSASPTSVRPGSLVTVNGRGFAPFEQVVLALNGSALVTSPSAVLADSMGNFRVTLNVPGTLNNGTNFLTAVGVSSRASTAAKITGALPIATRWYFPNGDTTGSTHTVLALLNPGAAPANVTLTFLYQASAPGKYGLRLAAHSRASVDLGLVAGAGRILSTIVEADRQIGAESTISYAGQDTATTLGASAPSTQWYLAEGFTGGGFQETLVIMNPNSSYANVDVRFLPFNGRPPQEIRFGVQPRANIRLDVGQYMPRQSVSTIVTSDIGVVVERGMRFGIGQRGAHDTVGVTSASTTWLFAQGDTGPVRQTFLTILNPNQATSAAVTATFFSATGQPVGARTIVVDALHRGNIKINDVLPNAATAVVVTSNVPIVVERPQYQGPDNLGQALAGSVVFGRNGGSASWLFPAGSIGTGTQELLNLFNPTLAPTVIKVTVFSSNGRQADRTITLAPNSRASVDLNSFVGLPPGPAGALLQSTNGQVFIAEQSEINTQLQTESSTQGIAQ